MRTNFERLGDEYEKDADELPGSIRTEVEGSRNIFSFIGSLADLFVPKLFMLVAGLMGGDTRRGPIEDNDDKPNKYPHLDTNE